MDEEEATWDWGEDLEPEPPWNNPYYFSPEWEEIEQEIERELAEGDQAAYTR